MFNFCIRALKWFVFLGLFLNSSAHANRALPIISFTTMNTAEADGFYSLDRQSDFKSASASVSGRELPSIKCEDNKLRNSEGKSFASSEVIKKEAGKYEINLRAFSYASGGLYKDYYVPSLCLEGQDKNTEGKAKSTSSANMRIEFDNESSQLGYFINVSLSKEAPDFSVTLTNSAGKQIPLKDADGSPALISGSEGDVYYLTTSTKSVASGYGSCDDCKQENDNSVVINVNVFPAPFLYSKNKQGLIANGVETVDFSSVGVIRIHSAETPNMAYAHCTGTVIGPHTILTAAHCLSKKFVSFNDIKQLDFGVGINGSNLSTGPYKAVGFCYPALGNNEEDFAEGFCGLGTQLPGFEFNPEKDGQNAFDDDIGLIYTENELTESSYFVNNGKLKLQKLVDKSGLVLVGYGGFISGGGKYAIDPGVKRYANIDFQNLIVSNKKIDFPRDQQSVCSGDSGGPLLIRKDEGSVVLGVTSNGLKNCTNGEQTRADFYFQWISKHIK